MAFLFVNLYFKNKHKRMISKKVNSVKEALEGVKNDMTFMLGGFGLCGIPENAISELVKRNVRNVTCISNNAGVDDFGLGLLLQNKQIKKMIEACFLEIEGRS